MNIFEYGNNTGIPLVLFGGTPQKGDAFENLDAMAKDANIKLICPTRPWYDDKNIPPSFGAVSTPLLIYLRKSGISSAHVMGGSGGGPFAFNLAKVAPETVATCTLLASMGMPETFKKLVKSPPTLELLKAFKPRDYTAWMETTLRWGLSPQLGHGAWGDFAVYFDELPQMNLRVTTPIFVYQSNSDPNAPLESVQAMLSESPVVSWHISDQADHIAMAKDPTDQIVRDIFSKITAEKISS